MKKSVINLTQSRKKRRNKEENYKNPGVLRSAGIFCRKKRSLRKCTGPHEKLYI